HGYLLKEIGVTDIAGTIRAVVSGQPSINSTMATKLIGEFAELAKQEPTPPETPTIPELTPREVDVLRLLARSMNNRQIGERLFITENTVKNHVRSILEKLGVHSRTEAAVYAVRAGYRKNPPSAPVPVAITPAPVRGVGDRARDRPT